MLVVSERPAWLVVVYTGFSKNLIITMRTNIAIDDKLIAEAQRLTGVATKRETVDLALRLLVRLKREEAVSDLRGALEWDGDLDQARAPR